MTKTKHIINTLVAAFALAMLFPAISCGGGGGGRNNNVVDQIKVTGVSVAPTEMILKEGDSGWISHTIAPSNALVKDISWKSDREAVATVGQDGRVEGKSEGTATITVTTKDGGFTATCRVTVSTNHRARHRCLA